ncbi:putative peptide maturation dehydrogenase [Arenimonas sp.]|uniref:putative peptide maturation dehydrogenase n=1 Tax=Arenimonas sp. TaxID=1872635 RepID=UPI0039E6E884
MKRPRLLYFQLREHPRFSLEDLVGGGAGVVSEDEWLAMAPHLGEEIVIAAEDLAIFSAVDSEAVQASELEAKFGAARIRRLVSTGLLIGDHDEHASLRRSEADLQQDGWWGIATLVQRLGRWQGVDIAEDEAREGKRTLRRMVEDNGMPPPETVAMRPRETWRDLPVPRKTALDELLERRATCRNFDPSFDLPLEDLSALMHRVFGAQAAQELAPGIVALKKNSPSGGGLHPIESYLLVQRVHGLAPGLYHYQPVAHALEPMRLPPTDELAAMAHELVAGQHWFANAPVLVLMAARFRRNYWKYRNHSKAWKVIQLDAGHLSQNLYLTATEQGYGAFVTGAINDECAERLFEIDGITTGAIVVGGFGRRTADQATTEFDPLGKSSRG